MIAAAQDVLIGEDAEQLPGGAANFGLAVRRRERARTRRMRRRVGCSSRLYRA
jgi:hypothetical protein